MTKILDQIEISYPLAHTQASKMLGEAFERIREQKGLSQRQVAAMLGYKASVVLSHMASGRAPIPIGRAPELAQVLDLDPAEFLLAVLEQREPGVDFRGILKTLAV